MSKRACFILLVGAIAFLGAADWVKAQQPQINPDTYSQLQFRYIGPVGNRATAVAGVPGNPYIYYVGAASGGIFGLELGYTSANFPNGFDGNMRSLMLAITSRGTAVMPLLR